MRIEATPLGRIAGELGQEVHKTEAQFDKDGFLVHPTGAPMDAATLITGSFNETHTNYKTLFHVEMTEEGSGAVSGPQRAAYALSAAIFKKGWPSNSAAEPGEINTAFLAFSQTKGDATCMLGSGVVSDGYGAFLEANIKSMELESPNAYKHGVHVHIGVVNDRDDEYYGYSIVKTLGNGGTAYLAQSDIAAEWDYGLRLVHRGNAQLEQRTSDAALVLYQLGTPANFVTSKIVSGRLQFTNASGDVVRPATPAPANYTPVASAGSGTLGTTTVAGRWESLTDKTLRVSILATITDNGTGAGSLRFTLPFSASTSPSFCANWVGRNLSTGAPVYGLISPFGTYVEVVLAANTYPAATGNQIWISGTYEIP